MGKDVKYPQEKRLSFLDYYSQLGMETKTSTKTNTEQHQIHILIIKTEFIQYPLLYINHTK